MNINELIIQMKLDVSSLSLGEKLVGGLTVTVLSMCIVFSVLVLLMFSIKAMTKILLPKEEKDSNETTKIIIEQDQSLVTESEINIEEEIAAIMAAISSMNTVGENKLVIRNITMNSNSNWEVQGRINQILTRI